MIHGDVPRAHFDIEVLIRVPGQKEAHRIGWVWAPMQLHGGDNFGRAGLVVDLGHIVREFQRTLERGVLAE